MKRTGSYILLVLCAMLLLSSCDPQARPSGEGRQPAPVSAAPGTGPDTDPAEPAGEDGEGQPWYGDWIVADYTFAPASAWSAEDARAKLGQVVRYGETASAEGETCPAPCCRQETVSAQEFSDGFRGGLTFGEIWLDGEEAECVAISNALLFGDRFYLRSADSLVIEQDGAFFLAERAGRTPDEASVLAEGCFDVWLDGWGDVRFVSALPVEHEDVVFCLTRGGEIVYTFPAADDSDRGAGVVDSIGEIAFRDVDGDGQTDVVAIVNYITGAGPQGMAPRPALRIYLQDGLRFVLASELTEQVMEYVDEAEGGALTMDAVQAYVGRNGVASGETRK